jgi:hypothetical protein
MGDFLSLVFPWFSIGFSPGKIPPHEAKPFEWHHLWATPTKKITPSVHNKLLKLYFILFYAFNQILFHQSDCQPSHFFLFISYHKTQRQKLNASPAFDLYFLQSQFHPNLTFSNLSIILHWIFMLFLLNGSWGGFTRAFAIVYKFNEAFRIF